MDVISSQNNFKIQKLIMKKGMILMTVFASVALLFSCSNDDNSGGGGGNGPIDTTVHATLFIASNTSNKVGVLNFTPDGIFTKTHNISSNNNQGIFYDKVEDELMINSKSQKVINVFSNLKNAENGADLNLRFSSDAVLQNPRDIAVKDDIYIVSDNTDLDGDPETDEGRFFVFKRDENGVSLRNTVTVDYAVWGIQLIGNDLYTVVDNTGDVAVLKNFISTYTTDVTASSDKRITIERINRIHGIAEDGGVVVITDIGDESNMNDGGFHTINRFVSRFDAIPDGGQLDFSGNQVRVSGLFTKLGNPVAVDYSNSQRTVFIAEQSNDGGKILLFSDVEAGGELTPSLSVPFEGASSLYFINR